MKLKQKNLRLFEIDIDDFVTFSDYLEKNSEIFKESFLLIKGNICEKVEKYLDDFGYCYKNINNCTIKSSAKDGFELLIKQETKETVGSQEPQKSSKKTQVKLIKKPIRSGERVDLNNCAIILSRINSGAEVSTSHSLELYDKVDGFVECNGEFLVIKEIGLGVVKFNSINIDKSMLDGKMKFIEIKEQKLEIKDIS